MNDVEVSLEGIDEVPWVEAARAFALSVLDRLGVTNWDLSLLLCDDAFIRDLNGRYRGKDEPTDVLSFEQGETYRDEKGEERVLAGDIVISLGGLARNVEDFGVSADEELKRLIVHGILHLSGMDHEDNDPARPMLRAQEELLFSLGGGRIL